MAFSSGEIRASFILDSRGPSGLMRGKHIATNAAIQSGMTVVDTTSREIYKLRRAIARGTIAAVTAEGNRIFALSQELVPVESGSLQRSGKLKVHFPGDPERKLPYVDKTGARAGRQHEMKKVRHVAGLGVKGGTPLYAMNTPSRLNIPAETGKSRGAQANISYGSGTPDAYTGKVVRYAIVVHQGINIASRNVFEKIGERLVGILPGTNPLPGGTAVPIYRKRTIHRPYSKFPGFPVGGGGEFENLPLGRGPRFLDRAIQAHRDTGLEEYAKIVWSSVKESLVHAGTGEEIPFVSPFVGPAEPPKVIPF